VSTAVEELVNSALIAGAAGVPINGKSLRKKVATALGLSRLRAKRYEEVVEAATNTGRVVKVGEYLYPSEPTSSKPARNPSPSPAAPIVAQKSSVKKTSRTTKKAGGTGKRTMGYLLHAKLRDASKNMPEGSRAAELFCHCPHCGKEMQVAARVVT
jgi:hypothetical protein